ncbi:MAG: dipeptide ABC transporter ATP-binding protein [Pseudomonadota bacterium]|nr:dipeptide ABC transporter ATP-binding protein [Pseudomonadota bacterium]MDP2353774.1 dipeptide ABC transporter ATP-binding protein [Pseudomonadota bacterium]
MKGLLVENLSVEIASGGRLLKPVEGVSFAIGADECVALLGESGCGKSMTALALMRLLPEGARVASGSARLDGEELFALPEAAMGEIRGGRLAMIFQEPQTSLNPVMTVAEQIAEALAAHRKLNGAAAQAEAGRLLEAVGLERDRLGAYPFQLSGGQRQRALIAMMLAGEPEVLIADEPTTALDVTVQAQILNLLRDLQRQRGMGLLLITHDLDVAKDMADRVAVMYAGQIVEWASRDSLYAAPRHPYTEKLFAVLPRLERRGERLDSLPGRVPPPDAVIVGCRFAERCPAVFARCHEEAPGFHEAAPGHFARCHLADPVGRMPEGRSAVDLPPDGRRIAFRASALPTGAVLEVRDLAVHFPIRRGLFRRTVDQFKAVDGVSLSIQAGETLALVGESGCGKSTLARAVLRLLEPTRGEVRVAGEAIAGLSGEALRKKRAEMQIVFQDPFSSLNPRMHVGEILEEGMAALLPLSASQRRARIAQLLDQVGLAHDAIGRYPHEFSGGQRQRIAIARALAVQPKLLILDEPTSALDVSVQAQILNLLADLQAEHGLAYLFITHNLPVVGYLAQRVAVMRAGRIVEEGAAEALLTAPKHEYTRLLLDSAPGRGR